jgi:hypothetical protein
MTKTRESQPALDRLSARQPRALALALLMSVALLIAYAQTTVGEAAGGAIGEAAAAAAQQRGGQPAPASILDALTCGRGAEPFLRTELFFGTNKPDGTVVTDAQFMGFLDTQITPRFPDGLTLLSAFGQFRGSDGKIIKEQSKLLILLYPRETARESGAKIEEIRAAYLRAFQQESVLRADGRLAECVSF